MSQKQPETAHAAAAEPLPPWPSLVNSLRALIRAGARIHVTSDGWAHLSKPNGCAVSFHPDIYRAALVPAETPPPAS